MEKEVEVLILNNVKLIYVVLKRLGMYNYTNIEKYYDVGMIGLVKGARKYDGSKGIKQSTYLTKCITNEILCTIRRENSSNRLSLNNTISLATPVYDNIYLEDVLKADVDLEEEIEKKESIEELYQVLNELTAIEQIVVVYSFGLFGNDILNQNELGDKLNLRQGSISRIKLRSIEKLRRLLNGRRAKTTVARNVK